MDKPSVATKELQTLVLSILAGSAIVQTMYYKETIYIKDLNETTTAEEEAQVITSVVGPEIVTTGNIRLRASHNGTQAISVHLPVIATKKLMNAHQLRIGWIN